MFSNYKQDWTERRLVVGKMQRKCGNDSTALNASIYLRTFIAKVYKTAFLFYFIEFLLNRNVSGLLQIIKE